MLRIYLKIAWRNLVRNRVFSAINIAGLAMGLASCLLMVLYVLDELSFDRFHEKAARIVRVVFHAAINGEKLREANVMPPVAATLRADYPEVLDATRLRRHDGPVMRLGDATIREAPVAFVDSNFFDVFTIPLVYGDARSALRAPNTAVITRTMARRYFGTDDAVGRVLTSESWTTGFTITGVIDPLPANSHFHFDFFGSMVTLPEAKSDSWMNSEFYTYLLLPEGYDHKNLEAKLPATVERYLGPQLHTAMGLTLAEYRRKGNQLGLFLQPLTDIHLHSGLNLELEPGGDVRYVYLFGASALFMLLIACINFMNLSTAGASKRGREVGMRKVLGSARPALVRQFLVETLLLTGLALLLAMALLYAVLPYFNTLAGKSLDWRALTTPRALLVLAGFTVLAGLLAGSYPAFFLSSFRPLAVLKGRGTPGRATLGLRSGLVVFQFFVSFTLIVGTTVVYQQLKFIQRKKLGYDKEQVLIVRDGWRLGERAALLRDRLLADARVANVTLSGYVPAGPSSNNNFIVYADDRPGEYVKTLRYEVDERYIPTLGMRVVAGRNFDRAFASDSTALIVNQTAARALGWGEDPLGRTLSRPDNSGRTVTYHVVGVVEDFHFRSLHEHIGPLVMSLGHHPGAVLVKARTADPAGLVDFVQQQWSALAPGTPFEYSFLDENFNRAYEAEQKTGRILGIFAGLTILIACLGLLGLAIFTAEQRRKELGVRKVLGASTAGLVLLLSRDFLKLVLAGIVLAVPVAWYGLHRWLAVFAYRVELQWWMFVAAGLVAVAIAVVTVSVQSARAALVNPVDTLHAE